MNKAIRLVFSFSLLLPFGLLAATGNIKGTVTDVANGNGLVGANISIEGTTQGAASDMSGEYEIPDLPVGEATIKVTYMGYKPIEKNVLIQSGQTATVNVALQQDVLFGSAVAIMADRAKERETPVAYSTVKKADMEMRLGSQDIPLVLNTTPSVYATANGGGPGDARVNIRGFDQRNIAIMINGVPINDMENGWVYWSNWDGVGDATSSIEMQRGLTAVNLATPAIGGAMNVITDPTAMKKGINFKQELGSGAFLKSTLSMNSGLIKDKFAFNATVVRKTGDGVVDKTWTDAWAYYFGASWAVNKTNRIELYAVGAPQKHGQNRYKQNIAAYSHTLAQDLGYSAAALGKIKESGSGILYNENWNTITANYDGKQFWNGKEHDRYAKGFINEIENYFHKPVVNLNWYSELSQKLNLFSTVYYSGGVGGGSGTYGDFAWNTTAEPTRIPDWDKNIEVNLGVLDRKGKDKVAGESKGILRNSVNNQWSIGGIAKLNFKASQNTNFNFGLDWRKAEIVHWREIRDLLGGTYFLNSNNQFRNPGTHLVLGDKIDYDNTNTVDWLGGYVQGEYSAGNITAYGTAGLSMIKYSFTDHFTHNADSTGELFTETDWISGYQVKGGASYRLTETISAFANVGYVSKVPIFDAVIDDADGSKAEDPKNETYLNFEGGVNYLTPKTSVKLNAYHTIWNDRTQSRPYTNAEGREVLVFLKGLNAIHQGAELEGGWRPIDLVNVSGMVGLGNWHYTDDVSGQVKDYETDTYEDYNYYVKDLKVGDQPQTIVGLGVGLYPIKGLYLEGQVRYYDNHYAAFDPFSRTSADDRAQSWQAPNYTIVDFHGYYTLPFSIKGSRLRVFAHVFNVLDELYVQDAVDNSAYNAFSDNGKNHSADDAEVYLGLPRTFNVGLSIDVQ